MKNPFLNKKTILLSITFLFTTIIIGCEAFTFNFLSGYNMEKTSEGYIITGFAEKNTRPEIHINDQFDNEPIFKIGDYAFANNHNLQKIFINDGGVNIIGAHAFENCSSLFEIIFSNSVTSIEESAFQNCEALNQIMLPNSLKNLGSFAFKDCINITNIDIPPSVYSIGTSAFENCNKVANINIPNSVYFLGSSAFKNCLFLTTITFPNTITEIADCTFENCEALTIFPPSLNSPITKIGNLAFSNCKALTDVRLSPEVTSIGYGAFSGCEGLTQVIILDKVSTIAENAFATNRTISKTNIFAQFYSQPADWHSNWRDPATTEVYWYSETSETGKWHFVGDVPTLWP